MIKIISLNALLVSIWAFFVAKESVRPDPLSGIPMCRPVQEKSTFARDGAAVLPGYPSVRSTASAFETDSTKAYSMPLLGRTPKGEVLLSWTEKDTEGNTAFCLAFSGDNGQTFSGKKVIYAGPGVGNSRLMRARVLVKKDGSLVAIFANRTGGGNQQGGGNGGGRGRNRSSDIVYCVSTDNGDTWTSPRSVDSDPATGIVRGFFDAVVLANGEIAVAYLKDVANSTKHEERDLRLVVTKNGVFQPEKVIDPVVCDCCNIDLLTDAAGALHVYYRDNNDDIRDMAQMTSTDNGETFSRPQIICNDGWKISGCPHSGAVSDVHGKGQLIAWYSGAETEAGIRLATGEGQKLLVLTEPTAKNHWLASGGSKLSILLWEGNAAGSDKTQLVFKTIKGDTVSETRSVEGSVNATNGAVLVVGNRLLVAHEVKQGKRNDLKISGIAL